MKDGTVLNRVAGTRTEKLKPSQAARTAERDLDAQVSPFCCGRESAKERASPSWIELEFMNTDTFSWPMFM